MTDSETSDLKAAAERVRQVRQYQREDYANPISRVYQPDPAVSPRHNYHEDLIDLADAYLATQQPDGEDNRLAKAIDLIKRCYVAGHREGWREGETNSEVFEAVNDFMTDMIGSDWIARMEAESR